MLVCALHFNRPPGRDETPSFDNPGAIATELIDLLDTVKRSLLIETGYLIAGIKDVGEARSGETVTTDRKGSSEPLEGYKEPKPMVFSGLYPAVAEEFARLREALEKLKRSELKSGDPLKYSEPPPPPVR